MIVHRFTLVLLSNEAVRILKSKIKPFSCAPCLSFWSAICYFAFFDINLSEILAYSSMTYLVNKAYGYFMTEI